MTHKVLTNGLTKSECKMIIDFAKDKWQEGKTQSTSDKRKSDVVWSEEAWMYDIVKRYLPQSPWQVKLNVIEPLQITRYGVGEFYDFHYDGDGQTRINQPNTRFHKRTRKLSMSIVLNDDFQGGEFEFFGNNELIQPKLGSVLIFPSYMVHRVNLVTKGTRYSLVAWFLGEPYL